MRHKPRGVPFARLVAPGLLLMATGCIASNVVAPEQRLVVENLAELPWQVSSALPQLGLYESVDIQGDAAASLRKVYYLFGGDGYYTAAALTEVGGQFAFQTLNGTWRADEHGLSLDDGEPVRLECAPDHVRISAPSGLLVLVHRQGG